VSSRGRNNLHLPLIVAVLVLLLWDTILVYPFKIFVVLLHEISHGLAAVATGGSIERITLSADQGGACQTAGGSRFWILNAGYLGSLGWGALLLLLGTRSKADRPLVGALGAVLLLITLLYIRGGFGFMYGAVAGTALIGAAWALPPYVSDALLRTLGLVSCLYVPWDIASDALLRRIPSSDASALGELTWIPGPVWGALWIGLSLALLWRVVRRITRESP
jgi:hypothetical protein